MSFQLQFKQRRSLMDYICGVSRNQVILFPEAVEDYTEDNPVRFKPDCAVCYYGVSIENTLNEAKKPGPP